MYYTVLYYKVVCVCVWVACLHVPLMATINLGEASGAWTSWFCSCFSKGPFFSFDHPTFIWVAGEKWKRRAAFIPTLFYYYMMMIMMLLGLIYYSNRVNCHLSSSWIHVPGTMLYSKYYKVDVNKFQVCFGFLFKCPPQSPFCASMLFTLSLLSTFIPGDMCNKMAHVVECRGGLLHRHFYSMRCTLFIAVFAYYFDEIVK